jgi:hypothetical protein
MAALDRHARLRRGLKAEQRIRRHIFCYGWLFGKFIPCPYIHTVTFKQNSSVRMKTTKTYRFLGASTEYHRIGPFTFSREQYEDVLQMARAPCRDSASTV